jgi:hypothetical protein
MTQEEKIGILRDEISDVYRRALEYFKHHAEVNPDLYEQALMSKEERLVAKEIADRLIEVMGRVALAVRESPLLDELDQREVATCTKQMRAALYFRRYWREDAHLLTGEDTVLGVAPGSQWEQGASIREALGAFQDASATLRRIVDLIIPGGSATSFPSLPLRDQQ